MASATAKRIASELARGTPGRDVDALRAGLLAGLGEEQLVDVIAELLRLRDTPALTPREREVLELVAAGATNREVADALVVSPLTVKKHLEHVYAKLGVRTRTAAAARLRG